MEVVLSLLLVALIFLPLALIVWAFVRAFRNRNVWLQGSAPLPFSANDSTAYALEWLTPRMQRAGYQLTSQGETAFEFTKQYRPLWLLIPIVFFFPLGLLALLYRQTSEMAFTVSSAPGAGESSISYSGKGPRPLRGEIEAALAGLRRPRTTA